MSISRASVRCHVPQSHGPFLRDGSSLGQGESYSKLQDFLVPVDEVDVNLDHRSFQRRNTADATRHHTAIVATTGKTGPRNSAYSIDYCCPTIVSGGLTVYDDSSGGGCYRKLSLADK